MDIAYQIRLFTAKLRKLDHQGKKHVSILAVCEILPSVREPKPIVSGAEISRSQ